MENITGEQGLALQQLFPHKSSYSFDGLAAKGVSLHTYNLE